MAAVAVVFGGLSPEHDISILTGLQAARLLETEGADVVALYWSRTGQWFRVPPVLEGADFVAAEVRGAAHVTLRVPEGFSERRRLKEVALEVDVVVNCCHGGPGEDGSLTALLTMCGIRVTGPTPSASAWAMDKLSSAAFVAIAQLEQFGIEAIPTVVLTADTSTVAIDPPWVLKPRFGGSSIGVEVGIADLATAHALAKTGVARGGAVLQTYLQGWSDLNIAVRTFPQAQCSAIERPLRSGDIYGFAEKYLAGSQGMESARRQLPADLEPSVEDRVRRAASALAQTLGLTGVPRIDFLYDGNTRLALCEVNAIPGSLGLYLWTAAGVDRLQVVLDLVSEARRGGVPPQWDSNTNGAALRAANTVAAKLR